MPEATQHSGHLSRKKARWCIEPTSPPGEDNENMAFQMPENILWVGYTQVGRLG